MIIILGAPRTKKTSNRILRFGKFNKIVPSEKYLEWHDAAVPQLRRAHLVAGIDAPVNCRAIFYREKLIGDAVGFYQGLADVLEESGVLANDKWIVSWDGSRMAKDSKNPRIEFELTAAIP